MNSIYFHYIYMITCTLTLTYAFFKDRDSLNIKWDGVTKFVGIMTFISMLRLCIFDISGGGDTKLPFTMEAFLFVWLEDVFFVMVPFYLTKKIRFKIVNFAIWVAFSVLFAYGHLYQGLFVAAIIGLYPYFISRKYALKTSFATVMVCHFIYDCATYLTLVTRKLLVALNM